MLNVVSLTESAISLRYVQRLKTTSCFVRNCCRRHTALGSAGRRRVKKAVNIFFLPVMTDCVVADVLEGFQVLAVQEQFITSLTQSSVPPPIK